MGSFILVQELWSFTVGFLWPEAHFSFSNLAPCWGSLCSLLHPWPALPIYTATFYFIVFTFQYSWKIVFGDTLPTNIKVKRDISIVTEKQLHCWKYFPSGSVLMSPPIPSVPSCPLLCAPRQQTFTGLLIWKMWHLQERSSICLWFACGVVCHLISMIENLGCWYS